MEIQEYVQDWVLTYCDANEISLSSNETEEVVSNIMENLAERGCDDVSDINDDLLAELVNREVESV